MNFPKIPSEVKYILNRLNEYGYEAYIVGGCVRDAIMGLKPHDWDITTSATPLEVKGIFAHTVDTGIKHGTVTIVIDKTNYEVTTYRVEGDYNDCRHPSSVSFTRDLHEDLLRRDFTMNAIAFCEKEGFVDIFGGIEDIEKKVIRGVGDAKERFQEDALRMLRAVRFSVQLDFEIEEFTLGALIDKSHLIKNISAERIRDELSKTLTSRYTDRIKVLWSSGLIKHISEELWIMCKNHEDKILNVLKKLPKELAVCYGAFFQFLDYSKAEEVIKWLRFDNKTKKLIETILSNISININSETVFIRRLASKTGVEAAKAIFEIKKAQGFEAAEKALLTLDHIIHEKQCISLNQLAINGKDLMDMGIENGKAIGQTLNMLLDMVLEEPELNQIEFLKKIVKNL